MLVHFDIVNVHVVEMSMIAVFDHVRNHTVGEVQIGGSYLGFYEDTACILLHVALGP